MKKESLDLKWGTLKGWEFHSKKSKALLQEYSDIGASMSVAMQKDTQRQKEIICELIDIGNFKKVYLNWDGKYVSKDEAKRYVMEYGKPKIQELRSSLTQ